ncbi:MAG: hypothetical protein STHCBS139747_004625 [Sporothrix thermara]
MHFHSRRRLFGSGISLAAAVIFASITSTAAAADSAGSAIINALPATVPMAMAKAATGGAGFSGDDGPFITFTGTSFNDNGPYNGADSVYVGTNNNDADNNAAKSFEFTVASLDCNVTGATLNVVINGTTIGKTSNAPGPPDETPVTISLYTTDPAAGATTKTGKITITNTSSILSNGYDSVGLYFQVFWVLSNGRSGTSYSRDFAFVTSVNAVPTSLLAQYTNTEPIRSESFFSTPTATNAPLTNVAATTASTTASTTEATSTDTSSSFSGPLPGSSGSSSSSNSSKNGSSGLSKGAIAGIVIGAIAAVAIVAALAFIYFRRRNNASQRNAYNAALLSGSGEPYLGGGGGPHDNLHNGMGSGTAVSLVEKDAVAVSAAGVGVGAGAGAGAGAGRFAVTDREIDGPNTPHVPHGPYTDDDGNNNTPKIIPSRKIGTSSGAVSAVGTPVVSPIAAQAQLATPGAPVSAAPSPVTAAAPAAAVPAMRGQVAALIEDDMTPEEIARLEAEERELDADIENANRNRAAANNRRG